MLTGSNDGRRNWTRDELIVAFNLYCRLPFSRIHYRNPKVVDLARILGRTPSSLALKLVNYARLDPELRRRHVAGMSHESKSEEGIWNEFHEDWEKLAYKSEQILAQLKGVPLDQLVSQESSVDMPPEGKTREQVIQARVNQSFFRAVVLSSYHDRCCITDIEVPELLVAGHIIPWAVDEKNRMNPRNGLCLNVLHEKAFDRGLITITPEYKVLVSKYLKKSQKNETVVSLFLAYDGAPIRLPEKFLPDRDLLGLHARNIFLKN